MIRDRKRNSSAGSWRRLWRIVRWPLLAYFIVLLLAMLFEQRLIFFPLKFPDGDWNPVGLAVEDAQFTAADGTRLHGWYAPHGDPIAYVLFLHGNAGNVTDRIDALRVLHDEVGAAVLCLDYRGFGKSDGSPNEPGVLMDARAARRWLAQKAGVAESEIVLLGRSLGTGVAVDLTTDVSPRALILESAYTSMPDVAAVHYPFLPARMLMDTRFDSLSKIGQYEGPLLQCHGTADEVIPFRLGRQLFDASTSPRKEFMEFPGATHNQWPPRAYYERMRRLLEEI